MGRARLRTWQALVLSTILSACYVVTYLLVDFQVFPEAISFARRPVSSEIELKPFVSS
jgi:hypothetical protein